MLKEMVAKKSQIGMRYAYFKSGEGRQLCIFKVYLLKTVSALLPCRLRLKEII
jgi:hypothetical protein